MTNKEAITVLRTAINNNAIADVNNAYNYMMALEMAIKALEQMSEWIPVNKRLPEKLKDVLVAFTDAPNEYDVAYMRKTFNGVYKGQGAENEWVSSMGETTYADYEISAWMPIPEYREGE